jgi:hypothetical protein
MEVARKGLNENEMRGVLEDVLMADVDAFPVLEFSALMLRLDPSLVNQSGLKTFSHNYLRDAVLERFDKDSYR